MEAGWVAATPATLVATPTAATLIARILARFLPCLAIRIPLPEDFRQGIVPGRTGNELPPTTSQRRCADVVVDGERDTNLVAGATERMVTGSPNLIGLRYSTTARYGRRGDVPVRCHDLVDRMPIGGVRDVLEDVDIRATQDKRRDSRPRQRIRQPPPPLETVLVRGRRELLDEGVGNPCGREGVLVDRDPETLRLDAASLTADQVDPHRAPPRREGRAPPTEVDVASQLDR